MALSPETVAIIDQLKQEGELVRAETRSTNDTVGIALDKFSDAFVSIAANIQANNDMLKVSQVNMRKQRNNDKIADDFKDLEREKVVKEKDNKFADNLGNTVKNAIEGASLRGAMGGVGNLMKMGGAAFLGYNILKGFIDEKYDGMFTKLQTDIGAALKGFDPSALTKAIADLSTQLETIKKQVNEATDSLLFKIAAFALTIPLGWSLTKGLAKGIPAGVRQYYKSARYREDLKEKRRVRLENERMERERKARQLLRDADANFIPEAPDVKGTSPNVLASPDFDGETPKPFSSIDGTPDMTRPNGLQNLDTPTAFPKITNPPAFKPKPKPYSEFGRTRMGNAAGDAITNNFLSNKARDIRVAQYKGANQNATNADIDQAIKNVKHAKIFKWLLRGLGAVGVAMAVWELHDLYKLYKSGAGPEAIKARLVVLFGEAVGGFGGFAAGAAIGTFGGPWGILIGGLVGGVAGAFFGGALLGAIWDWANEVPLTKEEAIAELDQQISRMETHLDTEMQRGRENPDYQYGLSLFGLKTGINKTRDYRNHLVSELAADKARAIEHMKKIQFGNSNVGLMYKQSGITPSDMAELEDYLANAGGTTVINAPTNVNPNITNTHGGNSKQEVNVLGGMSGDPLVYGLPFFAQ